MPILIWAEDYNGVTAGCSWYLNTTSHLLTISPKPNGETGQGKYGIIYSNGEMDYYYYYDEDIGEVYDSPWYSHRDLIKSVIIEDGVKNIGSYAFVNHENLETVYISKSVKSIDDFAFWGCTGLTSFIIPDGVTSIGECAFARCTGLKTITIPKTVTHMGWGVFMDCNLNSITFAIESSSAIAELHEATYADMDEGPLVSCVCSIMYVPHGKKSDYQKAYWTSYGLSNITTIEELPDGAIIFKDQKVKELCIQNWDTNNDGQLSMQEAAAVSSIGTVFKENSELRYFDELKYFTGISNVDNSAFSLCGRLNWVNIPSNVINIGEKAFDSCTYLTSINIPSSVTCIGMFAFRGCSHLTTATIQHGVTRIEAGAFNLSGLQSINIPSSVTYIGGSVFEYCSHLSSAIIQANITNIPDAMFLECSNLTSVNIPSSVTSINSAAFNGCNGLISILIPNNVTNIGEGAFARCSGLTSVICEIENPFQLTQRAFTPSNSVLTVPAGTRDAYIAAGWTEEIFKGGIVEMAVQSDQTLSLTEIPVMTYGDADYTLPSTTDEEQPLTWTSSNTNVATVSGNTLSIKGAGSATITATQAGNEDYNPFEQTFTLSVNKAQLTITADDKTKTIGEANPQLTVSYEGFAYDDNETSLTTLPTISTTATADSPTGNYPITVAGATSDNYDITYVEGTMTIIYPDMSDLLVNPKFNDGFNGWTINNGTAGGLKAFPCVEVYEGIVDVYQVVNNVPAGVYIISVKAFERPNLNGHYSGHETSKVNLYMNQFETPVQNIVNSVISEDKAIDLVNCFISGGNPPEDFYNTGGTTNGDFLFTGDEVTGYVPNGMSGASYAFRADRYNQTCYGLVGEDGVMKIGLTSKGNICHWVLWADFKLTYMAKDETALASVIDYYAHLASQINDAGIPDLFALTNAINTAQAAIDGETMYTEIFNIVDAYNEALESQSAYPDAIYSYEKLRKTVEDYGDTASEDALNAANELLEAYSGICNYYYAASSLANMVDEMERATAHLRLPDYSETPCDFTRMIDNPSFETGDLSGWKCFEGIDTGAKDNGNATFTINNADGQYVFNTWEVSAPEGFWLSQTLFELPAGTYKLEALLAAEQGYKITLSANGTAEEFTMENSKEWGQDGSVNFTLAEESDVIIKVWSETWFKCDNFRLTYLQSNKQPQTMADFSLPEMTYGDEAYTLPESTDQSLPVTWTCEDNSVASVSGNSLTLKGAGTTAITAIQNGNNDYLPLTETFTLTVNKAQLTITADDKTKIVGEANPELTVSYEGFAYDDTEASLSTPPTVTTTADESSEAGEYPITASGAESDNYDITYVEGILTVSDVGTLMNNWLGGQDITTRKGHRVVLHIELTNEDEITALQFNLGLPAHVSVAKKENGQNLINKTERDELHTLSGKQQNDSTYVIMLYSADLELIKGNSGPVIDITLEIDDEMEEGIYPISINSITLTHPDASKIYPYDKVISLTINNEGILGDGDNDGIVDVADIVFVANYILSNGNTAIFFNNADVDGDGIIDVADIVGIANIILNQGHHNVKPRIIKNNIEPQ